MIFSFVVLKSFVIFIVFYLTVYRIVFLSLVCIVIISNQYILVLGCMGRVVILFFTIVKCTNFLYTF